MRKMALFLSGLFWVVTSSVHAQTPPPAAPWPPDPDLIFAENVDWQLVDTTSSANISTDRPIVDSEARVIRVYDPSTQAWQEYPYPDQVETVPYARVRSDGLILVKVVDSFEYSIGYRLPPPSPEDYLLLNPASGTYTNPSAVCQGRLLQDAPGEGQWQVVEWYEDDIDKALVCHSETGEELDVLPPEVSDWNISVSPDGAWLVLVGHPWGKGEYHVFAYHPETGTLHLLGIVDDSYQSMGFGNWVSNEKGTLWGTDIGSWSSSPCYAFNVTQPDSLEFAFSAWWNNVTFTDNPPRYVSVYSDKYAGAMLSVIISESAHTACELIIYDAGGLRQYELGYDCLPIALEEHDFAPAFQYGSTYYYLATKSDEATVAELRVFDAETETGSEALFTAEIETILSVSPDQSYIVVLLDDNGALDKPFNAFCNDWDGWQVAIVGRDIRDLVYYSEPTSVYLPGQVVWPTSDTVVIGTMLHNGWIRAAEGNDMRYLGNPASLRRIDFTNGVNIYITTRFGIPSESFSPSLNASPNKRYAIINTMIVDLLSFEEVPVLRDDIPENYNISLKWAEDGALLTTITSGDTAGAWIVYRISVPEEDT